ncbi:hypothetical protein KC913_10060, partial [Proteus mirabilis]|uniref:hypothetical protein n=1 Tax=Proteus mirabilis TaxID=584 RepID=UPI0033157A21
FSIINIAGYLPIHVFFILSPACTTTSLLSNPPPFINNKFSLTIFIDVIAIFIKTINMQYTYQIIILR